MTAPPTTILDMLQKGSTLKFSTRSERFFLVQNSREYFADQAEAQRLLQRGVVRINGQDRKGVIALALNQRALQGAAA